jgi:hypothetical protein
MTDLFADGLSRTTNAGPDREHSSHHDLSPAPPTLGFKSTRGFKDFDLSKSFDDLLKPTDPPKGAALNNTTEVPELTSLESILP